MTFAPQVVKLSLTALPILWSEFDKISNFTNPRLHNFIAEMPSMSDPIHDRGKQMEDLFFKQRDESLLEKMRSEQEDKEHREQLISASGIDHESVIDALVDVGIHADSLTAVSMIPLVAVAWADRMMESKEVDAILAAAESVGITKGTASYELLNGWLKVQPSPDLLEAWKGYVAAVQDRIDVTAANQLRASVLGRAEEIAKAAGGFLGFGNKISESEQKVLDDLAAAF